MKTLRKYCLFAAIILPLVSCKKYDIKPADTIQLYKEEISVANYDPGNIDNFEEESFFSLNGYTADAFDVNNGRQSYGGTFTVNMKSANIDFGISGGSITTPGGSSVFNTQYGNEGPNSWAVAHGGYFSAATLSKASFDTLTHIEAIKNLTANCSDYSFNYTTGALFFFNVDRGYGIGYVKSIDQWGTTTFDLKYTITNP